MPQMKLAIQESCDGSTVTSKTEYPTPSFCSPPPPVAALPAKLLPELALVAGAVVYALAPEWQPWIGNSLEALVFIEVIFSLAQLTLTDIATRLKKSPPLWAGGLLVAALGVLYPEVGRVVLAMAREGWPVFLP